MKPLKTLLMTSLLSSEGVDETGEIVTFEGNGKPLSELTVNIEPVQSGTGDPSPTNIRPISGWTETKVTRTGKNLLANKKVISGSSIFFGTDVIGSQSVNNTHSITLPAGTYTLSVETADGSTTDIYAAKVGAQAYFERALNAKSATFTLTETTDCRLWVYKVNYSTVGVEAITQFQLELGSTATDYEPYQGDTATIQFGQTVYGGTLNVTTGECVVTHESYVWDGTIAWTLQNGVFVQNKAGIRYRDATDRNDKIVTSSMFKSGGLGYRSECGDGEIIKVRGANTQIACYSSAFATVADFNAYLAQHPMTICYQLSQPITLQLTPTELKTLLGQNNVFADTGDTSVTYRCNIQLYVDKKVNAVITLLS